jgi:nitrite reductase/ring-hydroxylating ferredoxin subunit
MENENITEAEELSRTIKKLDKLHKKYFIIAVKTKEKIQKLRHKLVAICNHQNLEKKQATISGYVDTWDECTCCGKSFNYKSGYLYHNQVIDNNRKTSD